MGGRAGWRTIGDFSFIDTLEKFPIRLETDEGTFQIFLGDKYNRETFEGKDLQKIKNDAYKYLKGVTSAKWKPVIIVTYDDSSGYDDHKINLKYERYFMATRDDGEALWKVWAGGTDNGTPGQNTWEHSGESKTTKIIPFTKEAWGGLQKISEMVEAINVKIKDFVGRADLATKLAEIATTKAATFLLESTAKSPR